MLTYRTGFSAALCALLCAAVAGGCGSGETGGSDRDVRITPVTVAPVVLATIETRMQLTGTIQPDIETFIGPKVGGRIEKFFADTGDFVQEGSPLLQLETVRFELAAREAQAALEETRKNLAHLENTLQRNHKLFETGILDKQLLDDTVTSAALARARADMARARYERARIDLQDATLLAPFSGFVVERRMNAGEVCSAVPGEYIFHLVDPSTVILELNIIETKKQFITAGKKVEVMVDALPGTVWIGTISVINPLIDPASRKFLVKVSIPNDGFALEPGMFARVSIPEHTRANALVVSSRSVIERDERMIAFVADAAQARLRVLELGLTTPEQVEVLSGLQEGEQIIEGGLFALQDGTRIRIRD